MKQRHESLVLVLIALLSFVLPSVHASAAPGGEITVWCMGAEGNKIERFARQFEREHPGCRIQTQAIPWSAARDSMITALVGDIAPDVVQMGTTWVPEFAAIDALLPLEEFLQASPTLKESSFFPASLVGARYRGALVAIPWYVDTRVIFYRTDLLRAAGWEHYPESWQELEAMGRALRDQTRQAGRKETFALSLPVRDEGSFLNLLWQNGGRILSPDNTRVTIDSQQTIEALEFYRNFIRNGYAPPDVATQIDPVQAFGTGYFASWLSGPWTVEEIGKKLPELKGRWAVAMVPGQVTRESFLGGSNLAMMRSTKNRQLSWAFIEFMSQPQIQADWFRASGDLPSSPAAWHVAGLDTDPIWSVFHRQIAQGHSTPSVETWQEMVYKIRDAMEEAVLTNRSSAELVKDLSGKLQSILKSSKNATDNFAHAPIVSRSFALTSLVILMAVLLIALWMQRHALWRSRTALLLLSPILIHFCAFLLGPTLASLGLSLTDYDLYSLRDWRRTSFVGLANYTRLMQDPVFWQSVLNTLYFVGVAGPLTVAMGLLTALGVNKITGRLRAGSTAACFLPVITPMVAVAVVWQWIYAPRDGLLNGALQTLGISPVGWLSNPLTALPALILLAIWKNFGYSMVIFLGGLQTIPRELYEAGKIDGTSAWQEFWHITLPLLRPILLFVTVLTTIGFMQFFAEPYIMTDRGGPRNRTLSIVLYLYKEGFTSFRLGYSSAIAYTLCIMIATLSLAQFCFARRKAGNE